MANLNNNINLTTISTTSTSSINSLVYSGSSNISTGGWNLSLSNDITDFFELVLAALGHDITYDEFSKMTKSERNQIIREIKLKTIL